MSQTMQMSCLAWIVVGAISGWLASLVMGSRLGLIGDIVVGIVGALLGGLIMNLLGAPAGNGLSLWTIFVAFLGAVILLGFIRLVGGSGRPFRI